MDVGRRRDSSAYGTSVAADDDLVDEADIAGGLLTGDLSGRDVCGVHLSDCRVEHAQLLGTSLRGSHLIDCLVTGCDLSGLVLEESSATRVEFRGCRLSGLQAAGCRFRDTAFVGCRLEGRIHASTLDRLKGADALRGVTIGSDLVLPGALAVFGALGIGVDDEP